MSGLIVDNFAGGGGASTGIEQALGRCVDIAINHDKEAIRMHEVNHPGTRHIRNNIWQIDPLEVTGGAPVELAWFSPDCKHFSKAKGGKPREKSIRDLAWVVVLWGKRARPDVIFLENVEEFRTWGPLDHDGAPIKARAGETFDEWCRELRKLGYRLQFRELRACDYGAPTIRKRFFMIARRDGKPIVWPKPTHRPLSVSSDGIVTAWAKGHALTLADLQHLPTYRTAAEIIDWSIPCPSIFERRKPLADKTLRRIAHGIMKFVVNNPRPFIVPLTHHQPGARGASIDDPMATVTGANRGEHAIVAPLFARTAHGDVDRHGKKRGRGSHGPEEGFPSVLSSNDSALVEAVCAPFTSYAQQGGANRSVQDPLHTVTASDGDHNTVVAATLINTRNGEREGQEPRTRDVEQPYVTVTAKGSQGAAVAAFLLKYYGTDQDPRLEEPLHSVTTKDRFGLVTVTIEGEEYVIVDIGMRMLTPRELFNAQGFPPDYIIDRDIEGRPITKTAQVAKCGNSVCPPIARALVAANVAAAADADDLAA